MITSSPLIPNEHPSISRILNGINQKKIQDIKGFITDKNNLNALREFIIDRNSQINTRQILCFESVTRYQETFSQRDFDSNLLHAKEIVSEYLLPHSTSDLGILDNNVYSQNLKLLMDYIHPSLNISVQSVRKSSLVSNRPTSGLFGNSDLDSSLFGGILSTSTSSSSSPPTNTSSNNTTTDSNNTITTTPQPTLDLTKIITQTLFDTLIDYLLLKLDFEYKKYINKDKEQEQSFLNNSSNSNNIINNSNSDIPFNLNPLNISSSSEDSTYTFNMNNNSNSNSNNNNTPMKKPNYIIQTFEGEKLEQEPIPVYYMESLTGETIPSILFITNFRVIFQSKLTMTEITSMPLATIYRVDRVSNFKVDHTISIWGKNFRRIDFFIIPRELYPNTSADIYQNGDFTSPLISKLRNSAFHENFFAYKFRFTPPVSANGVGSTDGWRQYDLFREFMRQGILSSSGNCNWRFSEFNIEYYNPTYPTLIIVPNDFSDEDVATCMSFRSKGRIPALSWISKDGVPLARSSQPMVGITRQKSSVDERLVNAIRQACPTNKSLYLLDARPKASAIANFSKGMGYELNYDCNIEFLGIANIHSMRESYNKLEAFCQSNNDDNWLQGFEQTKWWEYLRILLTGVSRTVQMINSGHPVLLHCSDGWDRTSQLASLAMILLDPYYRTIEGFQVLIEKEWLSFGHNFQHRVKHGDRNYYSDSQRSPIFQQFIDCVFQLLNQYPEYFEFNDDYLIAILDNLYSCQFGTFLCNSEKERQQIRTKTVSLWTYLNTIKHHFHNVFYQPDKSLPFNILDWKSEHIVLWKNYYQRYWRSPSEPINYFKISVDLKLKLKQLELQLQELKSQQLSSSSNSEINNNNNNNNQSQNLPTPQ
ncbi:hypothetical protein DLAC_06773 [Tieghemostelium lacteum]|uniref:Myotubularin phosphatase domain-containing protein n=1 Tax=Tieghemostelium lacteum TaxID=361077 RepID=A0A151ZEE6_TIELA|nr:hypothetical protein DLAC_06773 [Tieghemostelium lacteum]|eukprot:KYQ92289.1 hypothetical protein DLAC_06773 [Tieghemostelium lacteum]